MDWEQQHPASAADPLRQLQHRQRPTRRLDPLREFAAKTGLEITVYAAGVVRTVLPTTRQDPSGRADFGNKRPYIANLIVPGGIKERRIAVYAFGTGGPLTDILNDNSTGSLVLHRGLVGTARIAATAVSEYVEAPRSSNPQQKEHQQRQQQQGSEAAAGGLFGAGTGGTTGTTGQQQQQQQQQQQGPASMRGAAAVPSAGGMFGFGGGAVPPGPTTAQQQQQQQQQVPASMRGAAAVPSAGGMFGVGGGAVPPGPTTAEQQQQQGPASMRGAAAEAAAGGMSSFGGGARGLTGVTAQQQQGPADMSSAAAEAASAGAFSLDTGTGGASCALGQQATAPVPEHAAIMHSQLAARGLDAVPTEDMSTTWQETLRIAQGIYQQRIAAQYNQGPGVVVLVSQGQGAGKVYALACQVVAGGQFTFVHDWLKGEFLNDLISQLAVGEQP